MKTFVNQLLKKKKTVVFVALLATVFLVYQITACCLRFKIDKVSVAIVVPEEPQGLDSRNTILVDTDCAKVVDPYFYCQAGDREFYLCQASANTLEFQVVQNKKIQQSYRGEIPKDFHYENYHRFKVSQNTVSFQDAAASYEVYEYYDEESKLTTHQYGVVIKQGKAIQNIVCNKSQSRLAAIESLGFSD